MSQSIPEILTKAFAPFNSPLIAVELRDALCQCFGIIKAELDKKEDRLNLAELAKSVKPMPFYVPFTANPFTNEDRKQIEHFKQTGEWLKTPSDSETGITPVSAIEAISKRLALFMADFPSDTVEADTKELVGYIQMICRMATIKQA